MKQFPISRALTASIAGTLAMTAIMFMAPVMGLPPMNIAAMLSAFMHVPIGVGWAAHFMIGTMLGLSYALFFAARLPGGGWLRGAVFSLIPWLMSQVIVNPMMGAGVFAANTGAPALMVLGSLLGHLVFGAALGAVYGKNFRLVPGLAAMAILAFAFPSCSEKSTTVQPQAREFVAQEGDFAAYRTWQQTTAPRKGPDPAGLIGNAHSAFDSSLTRVIRINNSGAARNAAGEFPAGTILVKELRMADGTIAMSTAMVKRGGSFNPGNKGWEWFTLDKDAKITGRGADLMSNMCNGCHAANAGKDYVFTK